ncbi:threonine aldolase family protein [Phaeocystidibacter marisrubri]|uniref:Threonine aldolase n=1 Tax=Phaeocystidibacter marisrubri TaxID=1577780 RepID=A0A6L3ZER3_9FLAO|nr:GntG family PLP-dependent aldolase [Phaeocystidibacter marisrubri]KAB2815882.1 threonine aldolase [Phaeocystidibacter marisrubri]GGH66207.1 threonine aldolase [Phaeocystidibacter marisrubri]
MIDLRSDTVTVPTAEMLEKMFSAKVGDNVLGHDPTVRELELKAAEMFGMEDALFCPSGTMTNQIALNVHTVPGNEVICHKHAHIYNYEGGGAAFNSGLQIRTAGDDYGKITASEIEPLINGYGDVHAAPTGLISMENTSNKGGGTCMDLEELKRIGQLAAENGIPYHLDGARLFNALVAKGESPKDYGAIFDNISICLSKGLGCPVGSLLLGSSDFIIAANRVRKRFGGGMRQAGYLAAAGIYALDHHIERLADDHSNAKLLEAALSKHPAVKSIKPVETNIVIFELKEGYDAQQWMATLADNGIQIIAMSKTLLRMVTHLNVSLDDIEKIIHQIQGID